MKVKQIRYDELKKGDNIIFHGAQVEVVSVSETPAPANEYYPNEKTIRFDIKPANTEAVQILGEYYSHGTYGGVGCLTAFLVTE
jgi:hypothetical protein